MNKLLVRRENFTYRRTTVEESNHDAEGGEMTMIQTSQTLYGDSFLEYLRHLNLALFGVPCSGKTETAERLVEKFLAHLSNEPAMVVKDMGKIMREKNEANQSSFSQMQTGELADSEEFLRLVDEQISLARQARQGVIFTGQPRKIEEAEYFRQRNYLDIVFYLCVPEDVSRRRAQNRNRTDDDLIKYERRLKYFQEETLPVIEFFHHQGIPVHAIDADRSRDLIDQDIMELLFSHYQSTYLFRH